MNLNILRTGNAILNYHKICSDKDFTERSDELAVSVSRFKEQLIFLKKTTALGYDLNVRFYMSKQLLSL